MPKKKEKQFYSYRCAVTDKEYKFTRKAPNPEELISLKAYYDMHPEEDDRPAHIRQGESLGMATS